MGQLDVIVNGGKRGRHTTGGDHPSKDLKRPKKGELNFLPHYPEGMGGHNLKGARQSSEPTDIRSLCLRGLPVILGDDPSEFFKACYDAADTAVYSQTPVGILCMDETLPLNLSRVGIILEGNVVIDGLPNLPQAFCVLFGLMYALHLDYPKCMKHTFLFVQQVMLNLGKSQLAPKIQTLKNQLAE
ncbi:hypothetical protein ACEWY4_007522 [Coilia grayii]|uniref:Uncharacterized protein n=1 Tax=Coilia grayii TaxID=363190 RepID=A0ABD1KGU3_9TELE